MTYYVSSGTLNLAELKPRQMVLNFSQIQV